MSDDQALARLCDAAGILPAYYDIRGRRHDTAPDTARALLSALNIPAASGADVAASLTGLDEEPWREALPPVVIARAGIECRFAVHVPADLATRAFLATIHGEDGTDRQLVLDLSACPATAGRQIDGRRIERRTVTLPALAMGYHRLTLSGPAGDWTTTLIAAPAQCYLPADIANGDRVWGVAAQLYALRSARNPGMGEFTDLGELLTWAEGVGADAVGINPLHALFPDTPVHASPYSPNSRQFLNPLYLDVTRIADFAESEAARNLYHASNMTPARAAPHVDYPAIAAFKHPLFAALYENFAARHLNMGAGRARDYRAFVDRGGLALERFALHAALCEAFATHDWNAWPVAYRDPASPECAAFARDHGDRIGRHLYLQWQCETQLRQVAARGGALGIGIYGDLAVSTSADGADVWGAQDLYATGARIGAPPDPFTEAGQEWGVVPMNPMRMRKTGYANFIALLRANMRHFGALRIDHAMELQRLFWIPSGAPPSAGAYLTYPREDLLAIVALESQRNRCLVIGEDLGTVPEGFRERLTDAHLLSYRVLYFEQHDGRFKAPGDYPPLSAACVSTHDLPTLKGFWEETDLPVRLQAGVLASEDELEQARRDRQADKRGLLAALEDAGLLPPGMEGSVAEETSLTPELAAAFHRFLARSEARLFMVQIDDLAGEAAQANMPGTTDSYPNWRRRLSLPVAQIAAGSTGRLILDAVRRARTPKR